MAYIVPDSWTKTPSQAAGVLTTYAISLPPDAEAGDYIGVWIVQDGTGGTAITESGGSAFTFLGTQSTTGAIRTAYCFDAAATGGGSDVLTVACNSAAIWAVSWLVRGHHASPHGAGGDTPAGPATGTDFVYATEATIGTDGLIAGAMTTRDANTLNMYLVGMDAGGTAFRCAANEAVFPIVYWDAAISGGAGYNPATSTTAVRPTFYGSPSTEGIQILSIAIRWDGATDCGQPYCESNLVELDWLSSISANNPAMAPTWGAIDSTTIDGLTTNTATVTLAYAALANPDTGISFETVTNMTYGGAGTAIADPGAWVGKKLTFGSAKDLTNQILNLAWMTPHVPTIAHVGAKGIAIRLTDGTNWVAYTIEEKATFVGSALKNVQIELGVATELDHSGTVASALSGCTEIEFLWHRTGNVTTTGNFNFSNLVAFDRDTPATIRGGGAASPASAIAYAEAMQSFNQFRLVGLQSESQVMARGSLQIGDGTNETYWDSLAGALAWPKKYNGTSQNFWRVADNKVGLYDNAISGDTVKLRAGSVVAPGQQIFTTGSSANSGATRDFGGQVFIGMSPTLLAGETYSNFTLSRCGSLNTKGATLSLISVLNTTAGASEGAVTVDATGSTISSSTIDVTGTAAGYYIALGASVTAITLNGVTLSGTPGADKFYSAFPETIVLAAADALVDNTYYQIKTPGTTVWTDIGAADNNIGTKFRKTGTSSGTGDAYAGVTITVDGTGTAIVAGDVTTTTANVPVNIAAPQPTLSATVLANTRCLLWNRTTSAELDNTFVSGTSYSKIITSGASSNDVLDLYTFKEGYEESVATIIYAGSNASFAVSQATDDAIQYYRTQESITDYTTLTEFNFYSPDIYIQADDADGESTLKKLFIFYNGVLTTADGATYMRGGVTFNSAFDVVINRSVRAIAVDNVSVTYGLHFTDEATIRVTTDDGTSWIAPPSAPGSIRYAFGVSPGQIETTGSSVITGTAASIIAAIPSANDIAQEVVTGITF